MKKLSDTLKKLGIVFTFPIEITNANGKKTYSEYSTGYWVKYEYDSNGETYFEDSDGHQGKYEYDSNGHRTYYEDSTGEKEGTPRSQSCAGKVIEVDGKKYKLTEL